MPMITVKMFPGRTDEQKRALVKEVTEVVARTCKTEPSHVWVVVQEIPKEDWAVGGQLYSEL